MGQRIGIMVIGLLVVAGGVWVISRFWPAEAAVEATPAVAQVAADAGRVGAEGQLLPAAYAHLGVPAGGRIATLADIGGWLVETSDLIELDVAAVSLGAPAVITVDALPTVRLPATVTAIAQTPTLVRGDTTYVVTLAVETPADLPLRWGMTTFVDIAATP